MYLADQKSIPTSSIRRPCDFLSPALPKALPMTLSHTGTALKKQVESFLQGIRAA